MGRNIFPLSGNIAKPKLMVKHF